MVPVDVDGQISHFCSQGFVIREVVNKVSVRDKTSSPQHSRNSYSSGALIRIDFHPETAEKIAPHCMARLDLANCMTALFMWSELQYIVKLDTKVFFKRTFEGVF